MAFKCYVFLKYNRTYQQLQRIIFFFLPSDDLDTHLLYAYRWFDHSSKLGMSLRYWNFTSNEFLSVPRLPVIVNTHVLHGSFFFSSKLEAATYEISWYPLRLESLPCFLRCSLSIQYKYFVHGQQIAKNIKLEKATSERGIPYLSTSDEVWPCGRGGMPHAW